MTQASYVHGYAPLEGARLQDQARTLTELIHAGTRYPAGARVLEAGCGVGAQTATLAGNSPEAEILSVDLSHDSVAAAREAVAAAGLGNVAVRQADILALPVRPASFDHVFCCFVLEHLPDPTDVLLRLRAVLKPGGTITLIEGDHGPIVMHPEDEAARAAIACQAELQRRAGGDAYLGRRLHPLLRAAGFEAIRVSPRMVYIDGSRPDLAEAFTRKTFTAMIAGIRDDAIAAGLADAERFDAGLQGLARAAEPDGVFAYTFFKGTALKPA